jgi:hypothetical protein
MLEYDIAFKLTLQHVDVTFRVLDVRSMEDLFR